MSLVLVRVRDCDGQCCKESPRWPTADGKSCVYLNADNRCELQLDLSIIPDESSSHAFPNKGTKEVFMETCLEWPHNSYPMIGKTGECCWQWVEDSG